MAAGLAVEFTDVNYKVNDNQVILEGICGRFRPGYVSAVMGPSGAGKTSLLNILSGFISPTNLKGTITVGGKPRKMSKLRKQSCYITQEVSMLECLSVQETLYFAASLKLGSDVSAEKKQLVVEEVAIILGLCKVLDCRVKKLSGGEKKRVSIGMELVTNPPIMFCDEPTSGLDSVSSLQVMTHLQHLARGGRTIIVVIHSPSSRLLELIDDLLLIAEGRCIYNGSLEDLLPTLSAIGLQCPQYYNRADFAVEVACKERGDHTNELVNMATQKHHKRAGSFYTDQPSAIGPVVNSLVSNGEQKAEAVLDMKEHGGMKSSESIEGVVETTPKVSKFAQFKILFKRSHTCLYRDKKLAFLRIIVNMAVAVFLGTVYYDFGNDASKIESNFSCIFFIVIFVFYGVALHTVLTFPTEARVIVLEHFNNWYSLSMYYLAKLLAELPLKLLCPVLFLTIAYYMTGQLLVWDRFLMFLLTMWILTLLASAIGCIFGVLFHPQLAIFLVTMTSMPMFLVSGFFVHLDDLSPLVRWLSEISIFRYSLEAIAITTYGYDRPPLNCPQSQTICVFGKHPAAFLKLMGLNLDNYWYDIAVLSFFTVVGMISLYYLLKWKITKANRR